MKPLLMAAAGAVALSGAVLMAPAPAQARVCISSPDGSFSVCTSDNVGSVWDRPKERDRGGWNNDRWDRGRDGGRWERNYWERDRDWRDRPLGWDRGGRNGWEDDRRGPPRVGSRYDGWERHRVGDWNRYGLPRPPPGQEFAIYNNQIVKIDARTGIILGLLQVLR